MKLNKILWKADFDAFASRRVPVTGRVYLKQQFGPALQEMLPLQREMVARRQIRFEQKDFGDGIVEDRTISLVDPDMSRFAPEDVDFLDASIEHYWNLTGTESSDQSHGVAWRTRAIGNPMPYESAFLSDNRPSRHQWERLLTLVSKRQLTSN